jgi:osmotically-inducible protein OsmY
MRSDSELGHDVERELKADRSVDQTELTETVENGIVTLNGEVSSFAQKLNAGRAIERVPGVRGVANEVQVKGPDRYTDTNIAKAAADTLKWHASLPDDHVMVEVDRGWVTLSGQVTHAYQRRAAEESVRYLMGVRGVSNLITIRPHSISEALQKRIEDSFSRHAALDARQITVTVDNGHVTLDGIVHSYAERRDAEWTAWQGPGVQSVTNHLTVSAS